MMASCSSLSNGGLEYDFVDSVPESLSCLVCHLPFRDPHLLDCCGAKYCAECIGRVKASGQPCPICNKQFNTLLDKSDQSKVFSLRVRCSKKKEGCKWEGELRFLKDHEKECEWAILDCRYGCGEYVPRRRLAEHEQNECPKQPVEVKVEILVRKMEQRFKGEIAAVREEFRQEMEAKGRAHRTGMATVKEELKREMEAKDRTNRAEIATERKDFKEAMIRKDNAHKTEMANVREKFRMEMERKDKVHMTEMKLLEKKVKNERLNEIKELQEKFKAKMTNVEKSFAIMMDGHVVDMYQLKRAVEEKLMGLGVPSPLLPQLQQQPRPTPLFPQSRPPLLQGPPPTAFTGYVRYRSPLQYGVYQAGPVHPPYQSAAQVRYPLFPN